MIKLLQNQLLLVISFLLFSLPSFGQQVLFIDGDDNPALDNDGVPELYIQEGQDAFIFIQGGMTVNTKSGDAFPAEIVNNGAIFIKDNGTGGDFISNNSTSNDLVIRTTTGAALTYSVGNAPGTAYDTEQGTLHLMSDIATQKITKVSAGGNAKIVFHSLAIDGPTGTRNRQLQDVDVIVGRNAAGGTTGRLLLNNDRIDVNTHLLTVVNPATNSVERNAGGSDVFVVPGMHPDLQRSDSTMGMVVTSGSGGFARAVPNTQTVFLFPVGNSNTNYRPAAIKNGGTGTQIFIARNNGANPFTAASDKSTQPGEIPVAVDPDNYWDIGSENLLTGGDLSLNVRLFERTEPMGALAGACDIANLINELGVTQKRDAAAALDPNKWADENTPFVVGGTGGTLAGTNPGAYLYWAETTNSISKGANQLAQWSTGGVAKQMSLDQTTVGVNGTSTGCTPFPIELLNLKATAVGNAYIRLDWTTASEINNSHFIIERSTDGQNFYQTQMVVNSAAPGGNSQVDLQYSKNDINVQPKIMYYYRLRIIDLDGGHDYSNIVSAMLFQDESTIGAVYPNPTDGNINVQINCSQETEFKFNMYNPLGQNIFQKFIEAKAGENVIPLNISNLAIGTYELVIYEDGKTKAAIKVVKYQ